MKRFWISWYEPDGSGFELHAPWWISGFRCNDDANTICAAVIARDEDAAKGVICDAHDDPDGHIEWRFCTEKGDDWEPFCERFPRADWMQWPVGKEDPK